MCGRAQYFLQPFPVPNVPIAQTKYPGDWSNPAGRTRRSGGRRKAAMDSKERTAGVDGLDGIMVGFRGGGGA